ncbi:MAG: pseudouridine synthase, partial [Ignavibacteriaceae bacterium]
VGRLDYDTIGLLFLTNDGEFSQLLTHPGNKVPREYEVKLDKPLEEKDKLKLLNGIKLDGKLGKFIKLSFPKIKDKKVVMVFCEEGRNRFVKRMFGRLDYRVVDLIRVSYAGIKLDIQPGKYRNLTSQEIQIIREKYAH